jgi:lipopolysaccharide biosynthesis protein
VLSWFQRPRAICCVSARPGSVSTCRRRFNSRLVRYACAIGHCCFEILGRAISFGCRSRRGRAYPIAALAWSRRCGAFALDPQAGWWGFSLQSSALQRALSQRWRAPEEGDGHGTIGERVRIAVVVHLYYHDIWPEFEDALRRLDTPFHLIVTLNEFDPALDARMRACLGRCQVVVYPNKGRDVGPFMQLLREGYLDGFGLVCKLHGKRSGKEGPRAILGAVWRWTLLRELVGSSGAVRNIVDCFERDPTVGMIGSRHFRLPNQYKGNAAAWGGNAEMVRQLAMHLGVQTNDVKLDYYAGTMFWVRSEVLSALRVLDLSLEDFHEENGSIDGGLEHALERLFGIAVAAVGMRMLDVVVGSGDAAECLGSIRRHS